MRRYALLFVLAAASLTSCVKEEKEVCTVCTLYNDVANTSQIYSSVCLKESTMENYIDELYGFNDAQHHYVCTDPK
jgi:hypothetical protein